MSFNSVTVQRPYEQIVSQIQRVIRDGQYPLGSRLPTERELAESFGVSRSVLREAIKVLVAMGLVESRQGSGLYVCNDTIQSVSRAFVLSVSRDAESVERLFEFRQSLESEAARFAAERRTDAHIVEMRNAIELFDPNQIEPDWESFGASDIPFHHVIAEASGNPYLQVAIATARDMTHDVVSLFAKEAGSMKEAHGHHLLILEAIVDRDAARAAEQIANHIHYTSAVVRTHIKPTDS